MRLRVHLASAFLVAAALVLGGLATLALAQVTNPVGDPTKNIPQNQDPSLGDVLGDPAFETGILIGVATTVGVALLSLLFLGGTKFVNSENVLDSEARRTIFTYIREHPGTHLRATAQALDLSTTNVLWHLRKLESANLVNSRKFEGYKLFYPTEGGLESRRRAIALAVLKNENARDILKHIAQFPNAHQREIARALDVNHGTIRWHLRKLNEADLLVQLKKEHTSNYWLSEYGAKMLSDVTGQTWTAPVVPQPQVPAPAQPAMGAAPAGARAYVAAQPVAQPAAQPAMRDEPEGLA